MWHDFYNVMTYRVGLYIIEHRNVFVYFNIDQISLNWYLNHELEICVKEKRKLEIGRYVVLSSIPLKEALRELKSWAELNIFYTYILTFLIPSTLVRTKDVIYHLFHTRSTPYFLFSTNLSLFLAYN